MPGRADRLVSDHRTERACESDGQKERTVAKTHDEAEEIDREQKVEPQHLRVRNHLPEDRADQRIENPEDVDQRAKSHVPAEADVLAVGDAALALGILRI